MSHSSDPLDPLLDRWKAVPPPRDLTAAVWQKIATQQRGLERTWWEAIELWMRRPVCAGGFVLGCALVGVSLAELKSHALQRERNVQLARSYLLLIDSHGERSHEGKAQP